MPSFSNSAFASFRISACGTGEAPIVSVVFPVLFCDVVELPHPLNSKVLPRIIVAVNAKNLFIILLLTNILRIVN